MSDAIFANTLDKSSLRSKLRTQRRNLDPELHQRWSEQICRSLLLEKRVAQARVLGCYDAFDGEVDLSILYQNLCAQYSPPTLAFPIHKHGQKLRFYEASSWEKKDASYRRPIGQEIILEQIDVILVPGIAYSTDRLRLGFGGGFYDRTFPELSVTNRTKRQQSQKHDTQGALDTSQVICFGVAFSLQLVSTLPCDPWDLQVDAVVTEEGWNVSPSS